MSESIAPGASPEALPLVEIPGESDTNEDNTNEDVRKRRRLRSGEVTMLKQYLEHYSPGEVVSFNSLPNVEMKRALFPSSQLRLVEKELLKPSYNEDTGLLESVMIDPDQLKNYDWDLKAPEPKTIVRMQRSPDEPRMRRPRGILNNDKFRIRKLVDKNPRREGTHGWYNWEHCYLDGLTIPEYLSRMDYPRDIIVKGKFGDGWFNGPATIYLYQDIKEGSVGIYNSDLAEDDPQFWIRSTAIVEEDIESEEATTENGEVTGEHVSLNPETPVVAESEASAPG